MVYFFPFPSERCVHLLIDFLKLWAQFIRRKKNHKAQTVFPKQRKIQRTQHCIKIQYWKSILFSIRACTNWMPHKYFKCYSAWNSILKAQSCRARLQMCKAMVSFATYIEQYWIKMYLGTSGLACNVFRSISFLRFHHLW